MRTALLATLLLTAPLACTNASRSPSRVLVERQVNERLDRQLHTTLQKLLTRQTAQLDTTANSASLLTQR